MSLNFLIWDNTVATPPLPMGHPCCESKAIMLIIVFYKEQAPHKRKTFFNTMIYQILTMDYEGCPKKATSLVSFVFAFCKTLLLLFIRILCTLESSSH